MKKHILRAEQITLRLVRTWWRPVTCIGIAGGTVTNLVVIPLLTGRIPDLAQGAMWITACTTAFAVREVGKHWGTTN